MEQWETISYNESLVFKSLQTGNWSLFKNVGIESETIYSLAVGLASLVEENTPSQYPENMKDRMRAGILSGEAE